MEDKEIEIFKKYLPERSIVYCHQLWKEHHIQFTISPPRKSVYGNYVYRHGIHHISVNGDLSPESFLVTYLHEVAHLLVRKSTTRRPKPHGIEWQRAFRAVMKPMLELQVFGSELTQALNRHLEKPRATSCADPVMHRLLMGSQEMDEAEKDEVIIEKLAPGTRFVFQSLIFRIIRKVRTRLECVRESDGALYRFQPTARVRLLDQDVEPESRLIFRLNKVEMGRKFHFNGKTFLLKEKRRTRYLSQEVSSGKLFTISAMAVVDLV